ncbi:MAG: NYN domain-containing protein [Oscillospiraceae bacterium]|nr:NYN domain-containing protein [Oscillospiraceae bacterium]
MSPNDNNDHNMRLAVLIDADNAPRDCLKGIMEEVAIYGTPNIKKAYGDWSTRNLAGWKQTLLDNSVTPVQQFAYTKGKNSTDSAMIIDAMDILYSGNTDGFVLVSSDSDFTGLARRLREAGLFVIGIGEQKTPSPLIAACNKFIYIEVIRERSAKTETKAAQPAKKKKSEPAKKNEPARRTEPAKKSEPEPKTAPAEERQIPDSIIWLIADSILDLAGTGDNDYVSLGAVGQLIQKKRPDFDTRSYGYSKLSGMVKAIDRFEVVEREDKSDPRSKLVFIRDMEM